MYSNFDFSNYERNISDNFDTNYSFVEEGLPLPIFFGELGFSNRESASSQPWNHTLQKL